MKNFLKLFLFIFLLQQVGYAYYVHHPCGCNKLQACGWWGSVEYLLLQRKARFLPPLVTTNPAAEPILFAPGTTILFGDKAVRKSPQSGGSGDFGIWFSRCLGVGLGGFGLGADKVQFSKSGNSAGEPIFGRPYFNVSTGAQDVVLLSFPMAIPGIQTNGNINITTTNQVSGFDFYGRYRFFNCPLFKFDFLGGFFYTLIRDNVKIHTATTNALLVTTQVKDQFVVNNRYYAGLIGFHGEWRSCNWAAMVTGKLGIGNMQKQIEISGKTYVSSGGVITSFSPYGFLAQPSNNGVHNKTTFEAVPEINASVHLKVCKNIWVTAGYMYMFWHKVALAGDQIDLNVNPTQISGPLVGSPAPIFHEKLTSFWIQGFTTGLYFCY